MTPEKFGENFAACQDRLLGSILRWCRGNKSQAADILNTTALKALEGLGGFDERSTVYTWLHVIAHRIFIDEKRQKRHQPVFVTVARDEYRKEVDVYEVLPSPVLGPAEELVCASELAPWKKAIAELTEAHRRVIQMMVLGVPFKEMAVILDVSIGTALSRSGYARAHLKEALKADERYERPINPPRPKRKRVALASAP